MSSSLTLSSIKSLCYFLSMNKEYDLSSVRIFLNEATQFLAKYSWIYEVKNTDIFMQDVLERIPDEWKEPLLSLSSADFRNVPFNFCQKEWPISLQCFIQEANRLAEFRFKQKQTVDSVDDVIVPNFIKRNMPAKKLCETTWLTAIIGKILQKYGQHTVLDVGSGLGYLDQLIHHNFGVTTIGFETITNRCISARQRIKEGTCIENMYHINSKIQDTDECLQLLKDKLEELQPGKDCCCGNRDHFTKCDEIINEKAMMIGLHSCGDLMPDMMKLFLKLPQAHIFLCVSCCYHHLSLKDFPMSNAGKEAINAAKGFYPNWTPCTPGLRLGCQATRAYWQNLTDEEHLHRERCLFYRAAFQCFLNSEKVMWQKPKRHLVKKNEVSSFESFALFTFQNFPWTGLVKEEKIKKFKDMCTEKEFMFPSIKLLILLQTLLQPIWEGFILADRFGYFMEKSINCDLLVMCEEVVSPRNVLLFAIK